MSGLIFGFTNFDIIKNESREIGDYAFVFVKDEQPWPWYTGKVKIHIFEFKAECVGSFITPKDGGLGCWELIGLSEQTGQFK